MNIALISLLERILITLQLPHFMHSHAQSVLIAFVLLCWLCSLLCGLPLAST